MTNDQFLEIEVKFHLDDADAIRRRLVGLGAARLGRVFEKNARYEDAEHNLQRAGCLLRLRQDDASRLTYKCPPPESSPDFKMYRELEVTVSDARMMDAILNAIGLQAVQTYEKWRERFTLGDVEVCIDTMPFGCFLEIEGPRQRIRAMAEALGLNWGERMITNYLAIFQFLKQKFAWTFNDVTFANFASIEFDFRSCRRYFRAAAAATQEDTAH